MEFRYKSREISIHATKAPDGQWDWSFVIRGHGHRHNAGALAPTEDAAIDAAYAAAKHEIEHISGDAND
ncbi:hypothetical protein AWV79_34930 [Cupriavidus sp. UYMMa02A]|nr:hypothetical protein AWV79_34930 [Cupriavidus sp. UYMMa02A]